MKLSKELIAAGTLGNGEVTHSEDWDLSGTRSPRVSGRDPIESVLQRRERSLKVNTRGWKALRNVLSL